MSTISNRSPQTPHAMAGRFSLTMDSITNVRETMVIDGDRNQLGISQSINHIAGLEYDGFQGKQTKAARRYFSKYKPSDLQEVNTSIERAWTCRLCKETSEDPCVTRCGHLYCRVHLCQWLSRDSHCPVCKKHCTPAEDILPMFSRDEPRQTYAPMPLRYPSVSSNEPDNARQLETPPPEYPSSGSLTPILLRRPWNGFIGYGPDLHYSDAESEETFSRRYTSQSRLQSAHPDSTHQASSYHPHPLMVSHIIAHYLGVAFKIVGLAIILCVLLR